MTTSPANATPANSAWSSTPQPGTAAFAAALCQVGAEAALKREVARVFPALRPAYGRPGLVSFKQDPEAPVPLDRLDTLVFGRRWMRALGPAKSVPEMLAAAEVLVAEDGRALRLHVVAREDYRPGEAPPGWIEAAAAATASLRASLLGARPGLFSDGEEATPGERVLDVIVPVASPDVEPATAEPNFLGMHRHRRGMSPWPGGDWRIAEPSESPSRAYGKLEQALSHFGVPVARGQVAVEIGSAPGGASLALLRRGLTVVGVDPGAMDPVVLAKPGFRHVQAAVGDLSREQVPARVDWLLCDVNLAPQVALHALRILTGWLRPSLRGAIVTLKLNDWRTADDVPVLLRRLEGLGFSTVRARQLPGNRQEICAYATTPRGEVATKAPSRRPPSSRPRR